METVNIPPYDKERVVKLYQGKMLKDIDSLTYKLAETSVQDTKTKDSMQSDAEDGLDGNILSQLMDARESQLRKRLEAFLAKEEILEVSNDPDMEEAYEFKFRLPESFNDSRLKPLAKVMNDYIVKGTLMDWYTSNGTTFGAALAEDVMKLESRVVDMFREGFVQHPQMIYFPSMKLR